MTRVPKTDSILLSYFKNINLVHFIKLLRWNKPSGRLILLIPAGWSLWLTPAGAPSIDLISLIVIGGILISGAGCIANDLWDRNIDSKVERTKDRPIARGRVSTSIGLILLSLVLILSFLIVLILPTGKTFLTIITCLIALPIILFYPTAKRWFAYPQAILAICWGFSVLIPWVAIQGGFNGGWPLLGCWLATLFWTFGFDTVYAMPDRDEDLKL